MKFFKIAEYKKNQKDSAVLHRNHIAPLKAGKAKPDKRINR